MALTTAQAFTDFAAKLMPTSAQVATFASRHATVERQLRAAFGPTTSMPVNDVRKIGSVDRGTVIRPLHDIDLLAVFDAAAYNQRYWLGGSGQFITRVRDALDLGGARIVGTRGQAVRIFYKSGPIVDVAPVFALTSGGYKLPDGRGRWITTDPDFHKRWINQQNARLDHQLKPFARLMKRWNRVHSERLSSFHIEVMVANTFGTIGSNFRDAAAKFFDWGSNQLHASDPAGHGGDPAIKLTFNQQQAIFQSFGSSKERADRAVTAEKAGNHAEAIRLWRIVFGEEFPSYG